MLPSNTNQIFSTENISPFFYIITGKKGKELVRGGEVNLGSWQNKATKMALASGPRGDNTLILVAIMAKRPDIL
ncbi:hypothetical protein RYX36_013792 [Vicia faba]